MKALKTYLSRFAEYYFIILIFLAGYTPPFHIIAPAIVLISLFALQIVFKNKITGIALGSLTILVNLYMVLAMLAELGEFKTFDISAQKLVVIGSIIFLPNIIIAGLMIGKYLHFTQVEELMASKG